MHTNCNFPVIVVKIKKNTSVIKGPMTKRYRGYLLVHNPEHYANFIVSAQEDNGFFSGKKVEVLIVTGGMRKPFMIQSGHRGKPGPIPSGWICRRMGVVIRICTGTK
jgi:hypothetical protein